MNTIDRDNWKKYHEGWEYRYKIPANQRVIRAIADTLDIKNKEILEVGSGVGRDGIYLAKIGAKTHILDYVMEPLNLSQILAKNEYVGITPVKGDVKCLPFKDESFDLVFSQGLLEHFYEPKLIIEEQIRVLKKSGFLIIDVPQKYHLYTLIKHLLMFFGKWTPGWETEYSIKELEEIIKRSSLFLYSTYGDWSHPNIILKILMTLLRIEWDRPIFKKELKIIRRIKRMKIAHYTFQHIGIVAQKLS